MPGLPGPMTGLPAGHALAAEATAFPSRPLRVIVPFPAGGNVDYVARVLGPGLEKGLGHPIVVDNRPGAQGVLGVQIGAQAGNDGRTLTVSDAATVIAPAMIDEAPFDISRNFVPVGSLIEQPCVVAISAAVAATSLAEFIKLAQSSPGRLNFGSGAAIGHVSQELFYSVAGIRLTHVPHQGAPQLMGALLANEVEVTFTGPGLALPQVRNVKLRALAVTTRTRAREMPDVPTIEEQGFKDFEIRGWYGLLAPAGSGRADQCSPKRDAHRVAGRAHAARARVRAARPVSRCVRHDARGGDRALVAGDPEVQRQAAVELTQGRAASAGTRRIHHVSRTRHRSPRHPHEAQRRPLCRQGARLGCVPAQPRLPRARPRADPLHRRRCLAEDR
ncbi:MAG: Bug family tripartite tricarboxylate transporter substrate binding protein [bacterium]|nr:tripartite tricarboxylate transporter substrate binding protein [Betaproteobacteria bacterium]